MKGTRKPGWPPGRDPQGLHKLLAPPLPPPRLCSTCSARRSRGPLACLDVPSIPNMLVTFMACMTPSVMPAENDRYEPMRKQGRGQWGPQGLSQVHGGSHRKVGLGTAGLERYQLRTGRETPGESRSQAGTCSSECRRENEPAWRKEQPRVPGMRHVDGHREHTA